MVDPVLTHGQSVVTGAWEVTLDRYTEPMGALGIQIHDSSGPTRTTSVAEPLQLWRPSHGPPSGLGL